MIEEAFGEHFPPTAQEHYEVEELRRDPVGPEAGVHPPPESKEYIRSILGDLGCDPERTYFDVPRHARLDIATATSPRASPTPSIRTATPGTRLRSASSTGGSRSTPIEPTTSWRSTRGTSDQAVKNSSRDYNYYEWNATAVRRPRSTSQTDTRVQPKRRGDGRARPAGPARLPVGRRDRVLRPRRCTRACRTPRARRGSASTSARCNSDDLETGNGRPEHRLGLHGHDAARLPARHRPGPRPGGARRSVRRRDRRRGRARPFRVQGVD